MLEVNVVGVFVNVAAEKGEELFSINCIFFTELYLMLGRLKLFLKSLSG